MEVDGCPIEVEVAVSNTLPMPVLLGTDVPELTKLLTGKSTSLHKQQPETESVMLVTRAKANPQQEEDRKINEQQNQCAPTPVELLPDTESKRDEDTIEMETDTMNDNGGLVDLDDCRRCKICQKSSQSRVGRAPLLPLPATDKSFKRVAMDIVGPLPRSRGDRYMWVVCDYATRYPEEQVTLFSRVGVPSERQQLYVTIVG